MNGTATAIGTLDTADHGESHRMVSLRLEADGGVHVAWMRPGHTYELRFDGLDWRVTGGGWHRARLTRASQPLFTLPTLHGDERLETPYAYQVRPGAAGSWELWRLNP